MQGRCDECGGEIININGEYVCSSCGIVYDYEIQPDPNSGRVGAPVDIAYYEGLHTKVPSRFRLVQKKAIYKDLGRSTAYTLITINKIGSALNLPKYVVDTAISLYLRYRFKFRRFGKNIVAGAVIYAACKLHNIIKLPADYSQAGVSSKSIRLANKLLRESEIVNKAKTERMKIKTPEDYIQIICNRFEFPEIIEDAVEIVRATEAHLRGKSPISIAAAAVYISAKKAGKDISRSKLCKVVGISTVTLQNLTKKMREILGESKCN